MIDLHQGFTVEKAEPAPTTTVADVAMSQLEAALALSKGRVREAARHQLDTWRRFGAWTASEMRNGRLGVRLSSLGRRLSRSTRVSS